MRVYIVTGFAYFLVGCIIAVLVFYESYCARSRSQEVLKFRPIAVKSIMLSGALLLVMTLLLISHFSFRHHRFGLCVCIMISVLLSLGFLGFCYRFKINLSDSSVSNKNNEITNKKFIDKLKMRSYVFRGKDEKTNNAGKCAFCRRSIYSSGVSHAIKGHTVCEQCYKKIEEEKARIT